MISLHLSDCGFQRVDTTARAVLDIMTKTTEYLQPNPGDIQYLCMAIVCGSVCGFVARFKGSLNLRTKLRVQRLLALFIVQKQMYLVT